jgi:hypothetical protein
MKGIRNYSAETANRRPLLPVLSWSSETSVCVVPWACPKALVQVGRRTGICSTKYESCPLPKNCRLRRSQNDCSSEGSGFSSSSLYLPWTREALRTRAHTVLRHYLCEAAGPWATQADRLDGIASPSLPWVSAPPVHILHYCRRVPVHKPLLLNHPSRPAQESLQSLVLQLFPVRRPTRSHPVFVLRGQMLRDGRPPASVRNQSPVERRGDADDGYGAAFCQYRPGR